MKPSIKNITRESLQVVLKKILTELHSQATTFINQISYAQIQLRFFRKCIVWKWQERVEGTLIECHILRQTKIEFSNYCQLIKIFLLVCNAK